jgi:hypothetical protein
MNKNINNFIPSCRPFKTSKSLGSRRFMPKAKNTVLKTQADSPILREVSQIENDPLEQMRKERLHRLKLLNLKVQ